MPFELKPTIEDGLLWHIIGDSKENTDKCKCFACVIPLFYTKHKFCLYLRNIHLHLVVLSCRVVNNIQRKLLCF